MTGGVPPSVELADIRRSLADGATAADIVRATYARIRTSSAEHVWIHLRPEADVVAEADRLADRVGPDAPLFGVPVAVKDNIDVAGLPTTAACPAYAYEAAVSAPAVERLVAAGAVVVGKTNMDQFATGLVGTRSPHGACRSVLDPERISGGSSSGSAVAVAAGLVPVALGTDTAGSGRVPAACNGIVGLKPTRGRVPTTGVVPACRSLDCVSVFAATVADAAEVLAVVEGIDPADPRGRRPPSAPPASPATRWGVAGDAALAVCDPGVAAAFGAAVARWADGPGRSVTAVDLDPFLAAGTLLYDGAFVAERHAAVGAFVDAHRAEVDPTVGAIIAAAAGPSAAELFADLDRLAELARATEATWEAVDVVITPTVPRVPTLAEVRAEPVAVNAELGTFTNFVNLLDLCAVAVSTGPAVGPIPLGVTVVAPAWAEARAVAVAEAIAAG